MRNALIGVGLALIAWAPFAPTGSDHFESGRCYDISPPGGLELQFGGSIGPKWEGSLPQSILYESKFPAPEGPNAYSNEHLNEFSPVRSVIWKFEFRNLPSLDPTGLDQFESGGSINPPPFQATRLHENDALVDFQLLSDLFSGEHLTPCGLGFSSWWPGQVLVR